VFATLDLRFLQEVFNTHMRRILSTAADVTAVRDPQQRVVAALKVAAADVLNLTLASSSDSATFWRTVLTPLVSRKFGYALPGAPLTSSHDATPILRSSAAIVMAIMRHCHFVAYSSRLRPATVPMKASSPSPFILQTQPSFRDTETHAFYERHPSLCPVTFDGRLSAQHASALDAWPLHSGKDHTRRTVFHAADILSVEPDVSVVRPLFVGNALELSVLAQSAEQQEERGNVQACIQASLSVLSDRFLAVLC
jgi:hypothetical protein